MEKKFLQRRGEDLIFDREGFTSSIESMLKDVETIAELAWLRDEIDFIVNMSFGKKLGSKLPIMKYEEESADTALAYTE